MGNANKSSEPPKPEPGNASGNVVFRAFQSFEYSSGKMLCKAISADSRAQVDEAVEYARRELLKPRTGGVANTRDFADVNAALIKYLTQDTDVGDGPLFTQKPLVFCEARKPPALAAHAAISEHLQRLRKLAGQSTGGSGGSGGGVSGSKSGSGSGSVTGGDGGACGADRAAVAKERLKAFQETRRREGD